MSWLGPVGRPGFKKIGCGGHIRLVAGVGHPDPFMSAHGIEVITGGDGNARVGQEAPAEHAGRFARMEKCSDRPITIKRPVGSWTAAKVQALGGLQEPKTVARIAPLGRLKVGGCVKGGDSGRLRKRRRADEQILRQSLGGADHALGHDHPADAPARHAIILAEGVDDDRIVILAEGAHFIAIINEAVINLVRYQPDALTAACTG